MGVALPKRGLVRLHLCRQVGVLPIALWTSHTYSSHRQPLLAFPRHGPHLIPPAPLILPSHLPSTLLLQGCMLACSEGQRAGGAQTLGLPPFLGGARPQQPSIQSLVGAWRSCVLEMAPLLHCATLPPMHIANFVEYQVRTLLSGRC